MNPFKWFSKEEELPEPTEQEKREAAAFKNILKYGEDIGGMWHDACEKSSEAYREKSRVKEIVEEKIRQQQGIKLKDHWGRHDWNSIYIREHQRCKESPIGCCVTLMEYGRDNPKKDDPMLCFYCGKD